MRKIKITTGWHAISALAGASILGFAWGLAVVSNELNPAVFVGAALLAVSFFCLESQ